MNTPRSIPFARPWITDAEREAVLEVLRGDILTHGPRNKAFETEFAAFMGGEVYCLAVSSGMAALHLACWQLGIGPGDEVIIAAQTHVATAHAVEFVGAHPVFVDCDSRTGNIDPALIESSVTPGTKAIVLVHFLGIPCDMNAIMAIAGRHNLKVIEDCALAVGSRIDGSHVGLFGDAGCFSFYPVKHITTGDGGMFVTKHKALAEKVSKARAFGVDRNFTERTIPGMYDVPTLGLNYRMSDINAAIGREQLKRVGEILERRRINFDELKSGIDRISGVQVLNVQDPSSTCSHYCLSAVFDGELSGAREEIVRKLNQRGVGTSVYYPHPVPRLSYYRLKYGYEAGNYKNAARISDQSIALPVGPHLTKDDVRYIAKTLKQVIEEMKS
jgi:perosamine synthetase